MLSLDNSHDVGEQSEKLFVCGDKSHIFVFFLTSSLYPCHEMALLKISGFGIEKW